AAVGALVGSPVSFPVQRTSVRFTAPAGMQVSWFAPTADGKGGFAPTAITVPGRYNFPQAAIYRLKLTDIPGWQGPPLYPTLEVVPANGRTATFLAPTAVPLPPRRLRAGRRRHLCRQGLLPAVSAIPGPGDCGAGRGGVVAA